MPTAVAAAHENAAVRFYANASPPVQLVRGNRRSTAYEQEFEGNTSRQLGKRYLIYIKYVIGLGGGI